MNLRYNKIMIICAGIGIFLLFYFLIIYPNAQRLKLISRDTKKKSMEMQEEMRLKKDFKALQDEKARLQKGLLKFKQTLPEHEGTKSLLKDIWEIAMVNGVTIESLQPGQIVRGERYVWLPLNLNLKGDFEKIYSFISRIESLVRLIRVGKMRLIAANPGAVSLNRVPGLKADLELRVYISEGSEKGAGRTEFIDPPVIEPAVLEKIDVPRDPFRSSGIPLNEKKIESPPGEIPSRVETKFSLQGVMLNGAFPRALIDGEIYKIGEKAGGIIIKEINEKGVVFEDGTGSYTLFLSEEEK